ncbi:hypothetical protein [Croceicoccus pelagius]|uniref:Uncharacterized protein n=1 Tax=Croceicoccus pelagius TaxID=1703341 RepID=A0A916YJQ8_9SPHN|nr:hypothetical protein [Croceicoccus pelagius]GGD48055.1 hypothetical protein GCM10010989_23010 [Croceicoccus pelagius]
MKKILIGSGIAVAMMSSVAFAAVTFDATSGTGFVGKGDVQLLYGWNDQKLQQNAAGVSFSYVSEETYKYDCTFTVEVGKDKVQEPRTQRRGKTTGINSSIAYDTRKNSQGKVTGFNLLGFGVENSTGEVPVEGGSCPGGQFADGVISNVELISSSGDGLTVTYGGISYPLAITPTI